MVDPPVARARRCLWEDSVQVGQGVTLKNNENKYSTPSVECGSQDVSILPSASGLISISNDIIYHYPELSPTNIDGILAAVYNFHQTLRIPISFSWCDPYGVQTAEGQITPRVCWWEAGHSERVSYCNVGMLWMYCTVGRMWKTQGKVEDVNQPLMNLCQQDACCTQSYCCQNVISKVCEVLLVCNAYKKTQRCHSRVALCTNRAHNPHWCKYITLPEYKTLLTNAVIRQSHLISISDGSV